MIRSGQIQSRVDPLDQVGFGGVQNPVGLDQALGVIAPQAPVRRGHGRDLLDRLFDLRGRRVQAGRRGP